MSYEEKIIEGVTLRRNSPEEMWNIPNDSGISEETLSKIEFATVVNKTPDAAPVVTEATRQYNFPGNRSVAFENVLSVSLQEDTLHKDNSMHIVHTLDGLIHFVVPGWLAISIKVP